MAKHCACGAAMDRKSKRCQKCQYAIYEERRARSNPIASPVAHGPQSYDDALKLFRQYIGQTTKPLPPAKPRKFSDERIVIASDFHAPFQHPVAFADLCKVEADTCIVAGDLQDHYSISRFLKYETVPMSQELANAQLILEQLSHRFGRVLAIEGNHDSARFIKLLADRLPHEAIDIIRYLSKTGGLSTMEALCSQFANVELVKAQAGPHSINWFMQKGDMLVTHAEKYSRVPGAALRTIEDWFADFEGTLDLQPWRVIVQAHTHAMGMFPFRADKVLVECGAMCLTHQYQLAAKIGGRPQRVGWVTLTQRDGVTDFGSIRLHWWQGRQEAA